jgi:O-antigen biosynthesis protein
VTEPENRGQSLLGLLTSQASEPLFWTPKLLDRPSGWWGHVPFAFWLVATLKPKRLVELGTFRGVSYSAFCEAVLRRGLDTKCWAIDTWEGDDHVGSYENEIYESFKSFHDAHYGAFSQLLRMRFDDACGKFQDEEIDLLHIDGYHTYEAVRHDFETWRPKLSSRAIVLFHDTNNDLKTDIDVKRFFDEVGKSFPTFEFLHSFGLGVAAIGPETPDALKELFDTTDAERASLLRARFAHLGARWEMEDLVDQLRHGAGYQESLRQEIQKKEAEFQNATETNRAALQHAQEAYNALMAWAQEKEAQLLDMQKVYEELRQAAATKDEGLNKPIWRRLLGNRKI